MRVRVRRWSELSQVERVDRYTRQSLYVFLWFYVTLIWFYGYDEADESLPAFGALCVLAAALSVSATLLMRRVFALYPARGPLPWRALAVFGLLCGVLIGAGALVSGGVRGLAVLTVGAAAAWAVGGLRDPRVLTVLVLGLMLLFGVTTQDVVIAAGAGAAALFLVFTVQASLWLLDVVTQLDRARGAQAALAVAEERLRFSRDVHDVLGRRLGTIAVQAELAAALAERGAPSAAEQMVAVRATAHEGLREARELARGYRATDLAQELDGARSLLSSAGIEVDVAVADVPAAWQEPVAWVVREAVTNVLRHSQATRVRIAYDAGELTVTNDGATATRASEDGTGLQGLQERLEPLGASLAGDVAGAGFELVARFPAARTDPAADEVASA